MDKAEQILTKALTTPFNSKEAHWKLIEIAKKKGDLEMLKKHTEAMAEQSQQIKRRYEQVARNSTFKPDLNDSEQETLKKGLTYYARGDGYPGEPLGDALSSTGNFSDAIKAYEYTLEQNLPADERFSSQLGLRLYKKLASAYRGYANTLKNDQKSETEVKKKKSIDPSGRCLPKDMGLPSPAPALIIRG